MLFNNESLMVNSNGNGKSLSYGKLPYKHTYLLGKGNILYPVKCLLFQY